MLHIHLFGYCSQYLNLYLRETYFFHQLAFQSLLTSLLCLLLNLPPSPNSTFILEILIATQKKKERKEKTPTFLSLYIHYQVYPDFTAAKLAIFIKLIISVILQGGMLFLKNN